MNGFNTRATKSVYLSGVKTYAQMCIDMIVIIVHHSHAVKFKLAFPSFILRYIFYIYIKIYLINRLLIPKYDS